MFISDYVLMGYGTGAIMAVPAHDQRDYDFAKAFDLPIVQVLEGGDISEKAWEEDGAHVNSGFLNGMNKEDGMKAAIRYAEEHGFCATGFSPANVTGANRYRWFIARNAAGSRYPNRNCR